MANSLFLLNHTLIAAPPRLSASVSSKPNKPQQQPSSLLPRHHLGFPNLSLTASATTTTATRRRPYLLATNAKKDPSIEASETLKNMPDLRTLIQLYKEAIFDQDVKTVSDIEATIEVIENLKNELVEKVSSASAEITSGKEKYLRLQADFDNCRKRFEKERLTVRTDSQGEVIESLLPMVDNFERAKQLLKPESEREKKIDASYQGIYKQFVETMRSLRVAAVPTVGKPFDPSLHEAVAREESQEFKEGIVIQEIRRGFLLGGRLLRPAMVTVSSGPGSKRAPVVPEKSSGLPTTAAGVEKR